MAEHARRERFGAGQGHPEGWTLKQLDEGWHGMDFAHVAVCCLRDLVSELFAERRAHDETRGHDSSLRMRYAGVLKLLEQCSVYVPEEIRECIESAFLDATRNGPFKWRRVLDRMEIEVSDRC